ncbi:hypothetical protein GDO86_003294 [Hymenochirus boettgeri]|uniref:Specifically androgen-regulated gene protein n=1 Tax=Hymenochirus boettgeri TaxID=247094 RepID=A0A8T2K560_9PIPI|nr:hypothetical protein GDO86_003294 [Hymenochirus boettgeri]KAG8450954.1 hypothetical protein GDO86_003294 [Hymenochirus boettgeri]KAG8450955.1 hypothetical protein GDO86_003294 [Hymenochirus boettgeri]
MPEKDFSAQHVAMEGLNCVGSSGSCDSMESISSNHSVRGDHYDFLSAEERECLLFLEETIDSLENEADSGLSNDESDNSQKISSISHSEPVRISPIHDDDKTKTDNQQQFTDDNTININKIVLPKQSYHSFPRIIQVPKEETTKLSTETVVSSTEIHGNALDLKPKSLSSVGQVNTGKFPVPNLYLVPPTEPFYDPKKVDKRRSVTDPTDAREVNFGIALPIFSKSNEPKEVTQSGHTVIKGDTPLLFPRPLLQKTAEIGSQSLLPLVERSEDSQFKQGPPTAPKPRKLPPHIVIKPSNGGSILTNIDPQQRPRAFSAHERNTEKSNELAGSKQSHSKEQEKARLEALQKLGLMQVKSDAQRDDSVKIPAVSRAAEKSVSQKDSYGNSINTSHQLKADFLGTNPIQPTFQGPQISPDIDVRNDFGKNKQIRRSSCTDRSTEVDSGAVNLNQGDQGKNENKKSDINRNSLSVKAPSLVKSEEMVSTLPELSKKVNEVKKYPPPLTPQPHDKKREVQVEHELKAQPVTDNSSRTFKDVPSSHLETNKVEKDLSGPVMHQIPTALSTTDRFTKKGLENSIKAGSLENIHLSASSDKNKPSRPINTSCLPPNISEVVLREGKAKASADNTNRHSTHFDHSESSIRLPQSSVPGLRQISIKSNTLERSGIGLSSFANSENQPQKGVGSFFNFLRNTRPRPASIGTVKDFSGFEEQSTDAQKPDSRRSIFSRHPRTSAPMTSVKITPKGSTDEHRREALIKLGILKE